MGITMSQTGNESGGNRQQENAQTQGAGANQAGGSGQRGEAGQSTERKADSATQWFASTAVRIGLTIIGIVILLFALGQAVGLPLLELATDALTSQTGQWLVVAFFAILLIGAAQKAVPTG